MNDTRLTKFRLLAVGVFGALLFQGCAVYPPSQPTHYPPPAPVPVPEARMPQPVPEAVPVRPPPRPAHFIADDFSRQAEQQARDGNLDLASATLERGLRQVPKSARLWSQLAEIRLQQQHYHQARALAAKSNSLAGTNTRLMRKNQWIMEEALRRSGSR